MSDKIVRTSISDNAQHIPKRIQTIIERNEAHQVHTVRYNVTQESLVVNLSSHDILFGKLPAESHHTGQSCISLLDSDGESLGVPASHTKYISKGCEMQNCFKQSWHNYRASPNNCLFQLTPRDRTIWSMVRRVGPSCNGKLYVTKHMFSMNLPKRKIPHDDLKMPKRKRR